MPNYIMSYKSKDNCSSSDQGIKNNNSNALTNENNNSEKKLLTNKIKSLFSILFIAIMIVASVSARLLWSHLPNRQVAQLRLCTSDNLQTIKIILSKVLFYWSCGETMYAVKSWLHIQYELHYQTHLNNILLNQINKMMPSFVAQYGFSDLRTYFTNIRSSFDDIFHKLFLHILPNALYIISSVVIITYDNIYIGIMCIVWILILIVIMYMFLPKVMHLTNEYTETNVKYKRIQTEALIKYKIYYLYNAQQYAQKLVEKSIQINLLTYNKLKKTRWLFHRIIDVVTLLIFGGCNMVLALYAIPRNLMKIETLVSFLMSQLWLIMSMIHLFESINTLTKSFGQMGTSIEKISNIPIKKPSGTMELTQINKIELKNIVATYEKTSLFQPLNLTINQGETIAIIGPSGCGKTSLIDIIMGFSYDYTGDILFNNQHISTYTEDSIKNNIAFAQQDNAILTGTVRENLTMGFEFTNDQLFDALKLSQYSANPSIKDLEYNININGSNLSGGQAQRLKLARLHLHNKPNKIIVADEPTNSLDPIVAHECMRNIINNAVKNKQICLVITHNIHLTKLLFKKILFLNQNIWYYGTHKELYKKHDFYRRLFVENSNETDN